MTKNEMQLLFEYDRWANNRCLQMASALTLEQFTRDLRGSFPSVRNTLLHVIGGEWGWLTYWKLPSHSSAALADLWNRHDTLFRPDSFPDFLSVRRKWAEVEEQQANFVSVVTEEALGKMLPFRTTELTLAQLMQHMVNHSTYHRGHVAAMLRQLDVKLQPTDFHLFLLERKLAASHPI